MTVYLLCTNKLLEVCHIILRAGFSCNLLRLLLMSDQPFISRGPAGRPILKALNDYNSITVCAREKIQAVLERREDEGYKVFTRYCCLRTDRKNLLCFEASNMA